MSEVATSDALRALTEHLVDYAGLFPPAGLSMSDAVAKYASYRTSPHQWMLGRLIVPVARLDEFEAAASQFFGGDPWHLSVLTNEVEKDLGAIGDFNERNRGTAIIDTLEVKPVDANAIREAMQHAPAAAQIYFELPSNSDPDELIAVVSEVEARAKIRTGGVTPEAFPAAADIIRFIRRCIERNVAFKATAGLHHPIRCVRPLTYEPASVRGTMHGFINLFISAVLMRDGVSDRDAAEILESDDVSRFALSGDAVFAGKHSAGRDSISAARRDLAISFGSCSFEEPVSDLQELGWLEYNVDA